MTPEVARARGLEQELLATVDAVAKMRKRGIRVLPGGDYGKLMLLRGATFPASDFGPTARLGNVASVWPSPAEVVDTLADEDTALYVIDKAGIVRFAKAGGMRADGGLGEVWQLPTPDEIVGALREARSSPR